MASTESGRAVVRRVQEHIEEWKYDARDRAYAELFEGPDAALTDEELRLIDLIDSDLSRQTGSGLWDADEYGLIESDLPEEDAPRVVCTYHPEIPYEGYRGEESLDEATREQLNDVLWDYYERVASIMQEDLESFLRQSSEES